MSAAGRMISHQKIPLTFLPFLAFFYMEGFFDGGENPIRRDPARPCATPRRANFVGEVSPFSCLLIVRAACVWRRFPAQDGQMIEWFLSPLWKTSSCSFLKPMSHGASQAFGTQRCTRFIASLCAAF